MPLSKTNELNLIMNEKCGIRPAGCRGFILYLMPDSAKWTMPMSVFNFQGLHSFDYGLVCANMVLSILPMLAMYIGAQKYIMKGVMAGSVKG